MLSTISPKGDPLATVQHLIRKRANEEGVPFWVVEKDYALSYLLAAVSETEELGEGLVLKGGTALRKMYFKDYRFSEDIDYSTRTVGPIEELDKHLGAAIRLAESLLEERGPFTIQHEHEPLKEPHPDGQASFILRLQFPYHRTPMCRIKVEITVDEPVLLSPRKLSILHDFPEDIPGSVQSYDLAEIVSEKLRALLQSRARIRERGWATSRIARDYYDLWFLLSNEDFSNSNLPDLVSEKAPIRDVEVNSPEDFFASPLRDAARREWDQQLRIFVPTAPDVDEVLEEASRLVRDLWA